MSVPDEPTLEQIRAALRRRVAEIGTWKGVAEEVGCAPDWAKKIAEGEKKPSSQVMAKLIVWMESWQSPRSPAISDRERLQGWLLWLHDLLEEEMLPELVWRERRGLGQGSLDDPDDLGIVRYGNSRRLPGRAGEGTTGA